MRKLKYKILWIIPFIILAYLVYMNVLPFGGKIEYHIDVGDEDISGIAKLTGPLDRVSEPLLINHTTYRELKNRLVYFVLVSPQLSESSLIHVRIRLKDNFSMENAFIIGAHKKEGWNYSWHIIYNTFYENEVMKMELVNVNDSIWTYRTQHQSGIISPTLSVDPVKHINQSITSTNISNFLIELSEDTIITTNTYVHIPSLEIPDYKKDGSLLINTTLRGPHTFFTYIENETLNITITKQDLNWYYNIDKLEIIVYASNDTSVGMITIPDDGIINNSHEMGPLQNGTLIIPDLRKGVYKVVLKCNADQYIKKIETDQSKFVATDRLFVIGNDTFFLKNIKEKKIRFKTYHNSTSLQTILINGKNNSQTIDINKSHVWFNATLHSSNDFYKLEPEYGDIIIESNNYFSFTKDSYFKPLKYKVSILQNNMNWINDNGIEYIIIDYERTKEDGGWRIAETTWNTKDLYIKDNAINFVLYTPHLTKQEFENYTIPIDWIDINITVPPIGKRV